MCRTHYFHTRRGTRLAAYTYIHSVAKQTHDRLPEIGARRRRRRRRQCNSSRVK